MKILKASGLKRFGVQLASDGAWERAVNVAGCTADWIDESGEDIAIEAVYLRPSGELAGFVAFERLFLILQNAAHSGNQLFRRYLFLNLTLHPHKHQVGLKT
jgi:hypothetical protein